MSYWVYHYPAGIAWTSPTSLDSNAVPYLIDAMQKTDDGVYHAYGKIWSHLPVWLKNHAGLITSNIGGRFVACRLLGTMGTNAQAAIPELIHVILRDKEDPVRVIAADTLRRIDASSHNAVIAALAAATQAGGWPENGNEQITFIKIVPDAAAKAFSTNSPAPPGPASASLGINR